jgi:N-acetylglucosamine malate deacetylase 1
MTKKAFAIAAHPDDIEFMMSGTLMLLKKAGIEIHYMNVANGSCGTASLSKNEIIKIRHQEGIEAAKFAGAVFHESLADDIAIFYEPKLLARLSAVVREVAPDIILTHMPNEYMEDHSITCRLTVTAAFTRGMNNYQTDPPIKAIDNEVTLYHNLPYGLIDSLKKQVVPEIIVNVSDVIDDKTTMLAKHKSQKEWLDKSQGLDSYLKAMQDCSRQAGKMSGKFKYGEGWIKHDHRGFCGEETDPITDAIKEKVILL